MHTNSVDCVLIQKKKKDSRAFFTTNSVDVLVYYKIQIQRRGKGRTDHKITEKQLFVFFFLTFTCCDPHVEDSFIHSVFCLTTGSKWKIH